MDLTFPWNGQHYRADFGRLVDLSSPVDFEGKQPTFFGLPRAQHQGVEAPGFLGDTARGGGCNCRTLVLCPHGNGTHTESIQHIQTDGPAPAQAVTQPLIPTWVITVSSIPFGTSGEQYNAHAKADDPVITAQQLSAAGLPESLPAALVLRTRPNPPSKRWADYDEQWASYLTHEAVDLLCQRGVHHLLVDLPSIDRHDDGGTLPNHHLYWNQQGPLATITEMIYVPDLVLDGIHLLNLQVPNLLTDAVPSRPLLLPTVEA